jgi:hypothetical protein
MEFLGLVEPVLALRVEVDKVEEAFELRYGVVANHMPLAPVCKVCGVWFDEVWLMAGRCFA